MKKRNAWNFVFHTVGAAILVTLVLLHHWFLLLDVIVWATLREQAQHRYILTAEPGALSTSGRKLNVVEKRTFWDWDWFRWHHAGEIGQWALGAFLILLGYEIFFA